MFPPANRTRFSAVQNATIPNYLRITVESVAPNVKQIKSAKMQSVFPTVKTENFCVSTSVLSLSLIPKTVVSVLRSAMSVPTKSAPMVNAPSSAPLIRPNVLALALM